MAFASCRFARPSVDGGRVNASHHRLGQRPLPENASPRALQGSGAIQGSGALQGSGAGIAANLRNRSSDTARH